MTDTPPNLPHVAFNHLFIVLDDKTYRAVTGSDYLRVAFPGVEHRSTRTAAGEKWKGTYFYCQDTYLEFFNSGSSPVSGLVEPGGHWLPGAKEGWAGLAFSTSQTGGSAALRKAIQGSLGYEPFHELRGLVAGEKIVPWFYTVKLSDRLELDSFDSWLMEYTPDIFRHKGLAIPPGGQLTTRAYLAQWNAERQPALPNKKDEMPEEVTEKQSARRSSTNEPGATQLLPVAPPVFSRVIEATIHLDAPRAARYAETLALLGFVQGSEGDVTVLEGPDFRLRIAPENRAPAGFRLSSLRLAMARPSVAPMTFVFAPRSRLTLNDDLTAEWRFGL